MRQHDFSTTIAFIPWNWKRTSTPTASLFTSNPDRYSLVVHGCDHTSSEFGVSAPLVLNHKIKVARHRIEQHQQRTGLRVSPIMVFPQGVFSAEAAYVLKCNNFIAAVNTEVNPVGDLPRTEIREVWNVAIVKYGSFPIFTRRYMAHGLENFAFDALLGKPCLIVAHHEVFRNGARELIEFVGALNSMNLGIRWSSLESVIKRAHLAWNNGGTPRVRMVANELLWQAPSPAAKTAIVTKRESNAGSIRRVACNQRDVDWACRDGWLQFRAPLSPDGSAALSVEYTDPFGGSSLQDGARHRIRVGARRFLSELRDDYICRSTLLSTCTAPMRRLLK
jgi:hypothetical protein